MGNKQGMVNNIGIVHVIATAEGMTPFLSRALRDFSHFFSSFNSTEKPSRHAPSENLQFLKHEDQHLIRDWCSGEESHGLIFP